VQNIIKATKLGTDPQIMQSTDFNEVTSSTVPKDRYLLATKLEECVQGPAAPLMAGQLSHSSQACLNKKAWYINWRRVPDPALLVTR
jgi:hypothetical protein